jgi:hypothetical protein
LCDRILDERSHPEQGFRDYRTPRSLDRALFAKLVEGHWIDDHANLLNLRPGRRRQELARPRRSTTSLPRQSFCALPERPAPFRRPGARTRRRLRALGRVDFLILDDWGLAPLDAGARHDLLKILQDHYCRRSTLVTSQLPVDTWHVPIGDPTYADTVLERLVHNAVRLDLTGESLRRTRSSAQKT